MERYVQKRVSRTLGVLLAVMVPAAAGAQIPSEANVNQITQIEVDGVPGTTTIHIEGSESPTFSVYRLNDPARIFIDFSNSEIAAPATNFTVRDGIVDEVLTLQYQDGMALVTRVVVTLEDEWAEYDLETEGRSVNVVVTGDVSAPSVASSTRSLRAPLVVDGFTAPDNSAEIAELRQAAAEAERRTEQVLADYESAIAALQAYQSEMTAQQDEIARLNLESDARQAEVTNLRGDLSSLRGALETSSDDIRRAEQNESDLLAAIERLEAEGASRVEIDAIESERDGARDALGTLQREYDDLLVDAETAQLALVSAENGLQASSTSRDVAQNQAEDAMAEMQVLEEELARLSDASEASEAALATRNTQLRSLETQVEEIRAQEQTQRERAEALSDQLAEAEAEIGLLHASERATQGDLDQLRGQSSALEAELEAAGAASSRRGELQRALDETERELELAESDIVMIAALRADYEDDAEQARASQEQALRDLAEATVAREQAEQAARESRSQLANIEDMLEQRLGEHASLEDELDNARSERASLNSQLSQLEADQLRAERGLIEARSERMEVESAIATLAEERAETERELETARVERERAQAELSALQDEQGDVERELEDAVVARERVEDELARLSDERVSAVEARDTVEDELARLSDERVSAAEARERVEDELARLSDERVSAVEARDTVEDDLARLSDERVFAVEARDTVEDDLARLSDEREGMARELADLESSMSELESQHASQLSTLRRAERENRRLAEIEAEIAELHELESVRDDVVAERATLEQERRDLETRVIGEMATLRAEVEADLETQRNALADREAELETMILAQEASAEVQRVEMEAALRAEYEQQLEDQVRALQAAQDDDEAVLLAQNAPATEQTQATDGTYAPAVSGPTEIVDVRFEQTDGIDRVLIEFNNPGGNVESIPWSEGRAGLVLSGVDLPLALERTLDTRAFGGPIRFVSSFNDTDDGSVRLVAELSAAASEILTRSGNIVAWEFSGIISDEQLESLAYADGGFEGYNSQEAQGGPPPIQRPSGVYNIGEQRETLQLPRLAQRYRVTIDVINADIQNVLRLFSDQGDVNIIASNISGTITLRLRDVPLDLAFSLILQSQGLGFEQRGNIIRVARQEEFDEERRRRAEALAEAFDVEPLQVRLIPVSYAEGGSMTSLVADVLSNRGTASFDDRTHTLILTDVADNLNAAEQLIAALDTQTPQILIEARIVQTSETYSEGFGIQWGGDALMSPANGNATGLLFPSTIGIAGGAGQTPNEGTSSTPNYAVNVPGPSTGAIGFQFGSLGQAVNLNLRLSAAESVGEAKVVSAPRILTLDGMAATITSGISIPVQTVGAAGTNVSFIDASLSLTVTPRVTPDGYVHLEVNVTKNEPDFARRGANGDPSIVTRTAQTQLLVADGETSVIGGIFEHLQGTEQTGVPFFSDIPILGALFHDYSFQDERNETLIFITPRIVNRELSLTNYEPGGVLMTPPSSDE